MAQSNTGFPTLKPAVILTCRIENVNPLGVIHGGSKLIHFEAPNGTIESVPGFEPAFKSEITFCADWMSFDPDGKHARVDIRGIAKTTSGYFLDFRNTGVIWLSPEVQKIFNMEPDMATAPLSMSTTSPTFRVGDPALKVLENSTFAGNFRIIVDEKGLTIDSRMSLVVPSQDAE